MTSKSQSGRPRAATRSTARLAAAQALYQMDVAQTDVNAVIAEFIAHRFGREVEGHHYAEADADFFAAIVSGVVAEQDKIDSAISGFLAEGWKLSRLDSILRAILRAGAYELMHRPDVPLKVTINEYLDVSHAFFEDGDEPGVVNGVLDKLARQVRTRGEDGAEVKVD